MLAIRGRGRDPVRGVCCPDHRLGGVAGVPLRMARAASSTRLVTPSLAKAWATWPLYGVAGDKQPFGDLDVVETFTDESDYAEFGWGERIPAGSGSVSAAAAGSGEGEGIVERQSLTLRPRLVELIGAETLLELGGGRCVFEISEVTSGVSIADRRLVSA